MLLKVAHRRYDVGNVDSTSDQMSLVPLRPRPFHTISLQLSAS